MLNICIDYLLEPLESGELMIKKYTGTSKKEIVIPSCIDGINIKIIGENAFANHKEIEKVIISEGISEIHNGAFFECKSLSEIILPSTLKLLGNTTNINPQKTSHQGSPQLPLGIFSSCPIKKINLPTGLLFIGSRAFMECHELESINLPNKIKEIKEYTFFGCKSLKHIVLPNSLTKLGAYSFYDSGITSVDIPKTVTEIDIYAFGKCVNLWKVSLHEGLVKIGDYAFKNCLTRCFTIPRSVLFIGENTFGDAFPTLECYDRTYGLNYTRRKGYGIRNLGK